MSPRITAAFVLLLLTCGCHAEVAIDPARRSVTVSGFSAQVPGTLTDVVAAANDAGWQGISSDDASETVEIDGSLIVGAGDGSSTYFRIGTPERPTETIVLKGDLVLSQPKPVPNAHRQFTGSNQLLIGDRDLPQVRPTVKFDCDEPRQYGLIVGDGAVLDVHNALITAADQQAEHVAKCEIHTSEARISHSTFSWIGGPMTYGLGSLARPLQGVSFEHGGAALYNGGQWAVDCVFRDLETAVQDSGSLDATLVRCRFEGNRRNWALGYTSAGIMAIDCEFGEEEEPGPHIRRWRSEDGPWQHPRFIALRHIVVHVTDEAGNPIEGALVEIAEIGGQPGFVHHAATRTRADGRTPGIDERRALLVTDYTHAATDDVPEPESRDCRIESTDCRYVMRVTADGYQEITVADVDPDESWSGLTVEMQIR